LGRWSINIIAILASVLTPNMTKGKERAKLTACKSNLRLIGIAAEMYANDNNQLFFPLKDIEEDIDESIVYVQQGYLKTVPHCPSNPTLYYVASGRYDGKNFHVYCRGGHPYFDLPAGQPRWDNERGGIKESSY